MLILRIMIVIDCAFHAFSFNLSKVKTKNNNSEFLKSMFQEKLKDQNVHIIVNDEVSNDLSNFLQVAHEYCSSVYLSTSSNIVNLIQELPSHLIRGKFFITIFIFLNNPETFFAHLALNLKWNPDYLILVSLNENFDTGSIIRNHVIQRSRYILLCEKGVKRYGNFRLFSIKPHLKNESGKSLKKPLGNWNGEFFIAGSLFQERFNNLDNVTLQATSWCDEFPYLYFVNNTCLGLNLDIMDMIAMNLNFSYEIQVQPDDGIWGFIENGTGFGMFGEMMYNNKDIALNPPSDDVMNYFDILYPFHYENFVIVLRLPPPIPQWQTALYPFSKLVWIILIVVTIGIMILFTTMLILGVDSQTPDTVFMIVSNLYKFLQFLKYIRSPTTFK